LSLITPTSDYADLDGCDLVIEAVFEDSEVKKGATEKAEAVLKRGDLRLQHLDHADHRPGEEFEAPEEFIGIHFFSPVDKMMLVEIILGKKTGDKAIATAIDYVAPSRRRRSSSTTRAASTSTAACCATCRKPMRC
jgi:3-hydroxyacyl-CoA dehydrogenase/enoyl-CoA hydratase/3-hydroxybutyryl-CoA epimerase